MTYTALGDRSPVHSAPLPQVPFCARLGFLSFILNTVQSYLFACLLFICFPLPAHELWEEGRSCFLLCLLCLGECLVHNRFLKLSTKNEKLFVVCLPRLDHDAPEAGDCICVVLTPGPPLFKQPGRPAV